MFKIGPTKNKLRLIIFVVALLLLVSFLAHDIIPHHHKVEIYGSGMQAMFHGGDRKLLYLILLAISVASLLNNKISIISINRNFHSKVLYSRIAVSKIFDPISNALRTGILNTKLCD